MRSPQFGWEGQNSPSNSPLPLPRLNTERQRRKAERRKYRIELPLLALKPRVQKDREKTTEV
ncbi:hypothetical protein BKH46_08975 [Helicobacter sp. 12S02634-8]|nr:hypothetical protein BKH46_08975 [Helicobacter sp. 12S02634-8]